MLKLPLVRRLAKQLLLGLLFWRLHLHLLPRRPKLLRLLRLHLVLDRLHLVLDRLHLVLHWLHLVLCRLAIRTKLTLLLGLLHLHWLLWRELRLLLGLLYSHAILVSLRGARLIARLHVRFRIPEFLIPRLQRGMLCLRPCWNIWRRRNINTR